jgi:hypothetical protein
VIPDFVRQHVTKAGNPKVAYETEEEASRAGRAYHPRQNPYRCSLCGRWHLSSKKVDQKWSPKVPWYEPGERERA